MTLKRTHVHTVAISLLFTLSIFIRWSHVENLSISSPIRGDAASYVQYAQNLGAHSTFSRSITSPLVPDSYWAPGYPFYISLFNDTDGKFDFYEYKNVLVSQTFLGSLSVVLVYLLGIMYLPIGFAVGAAFLTALSPHLISMSGYILTETLFSFLLILAIYLYCQANLSQSRLLYLISAITFGLSYLTNPVVIVVPLSFIAIKIFKKRSGIENQLLCLFTAIFIAFPLSWQIRNQIVVPEDAPKSSERILTNLVIGSHSNFHAIWRANPRDPSNPATIDENNIEGSFSSFLGLLAERVIDNPSHYIYWYFIGKPLQLWEWNILTGQGDVFVYPVSSSIYHTSKTAILSHVVMKRFHYFFFAFAILGFVFLAVSKRNTRVPLHIYASVISVSAVYVVLQSEARYSIPLRPEMYLCAMYFCYQLSLRIKRKNEE